MHKLQWFVNMWIFMVTHTRCQLESNVNNFHLLKYPTEFSAYDFNKTPTLKLCHYKHGDDASAVPSISHSPHSSRPNEQNAFLLKVFKNIAQQIQQSQCGKSKSLTTTTIPKQSSAQEDPEDKIVPTSERSLRVYYKGQRPEEVVGTFDILEQLKLDETNQQQHQKLKLPSQEEQQQKPNEIQQVFWEDVSFEHQGKAGKKKKKKKKKPNKDKKKKRKKKKRKKQTKPSFVGQPAHVLFATLAQKPPQLLPQHVTPAVPLTTSKPHHQFAPIKKIKYILRKNSIFKKKKKEYLNHLKQVIYPFVKFIAFFTILNPFTLAIFLFTLISPVVFGFIGFIGLSFLIKPALNILFGIKRTVSSINRKKLLQKRKRERLRNSRRPITVHKHYYQQTRLPAPHRRPHRPNQHHHHHRQSKHFNPLLPHVRHKLKKDALFGPNFVRYENNTNGN